MKIEHHVACVGCGYDLRGMETHGSCPECGGAVVEALAASRSVTGRQVAHLVCRILALWLAVGCVLQVATMALNIAGMLYQGSGGAEWWWLLFSMAYLVVQLAICAGLWFGAGWIAQRMVPDDGPGIPSQQWTAADLMNVAVSVLGLYLAATGLASAAGALAGEGIASWLDVDPFDANLLGGSVRFILGLLLIAGRDRLAKAWNTARTAGT